MPRGRGTPTVAARLRLDGAVYASPIVVGGTIVVATENDTVYALDRAYRPGAGSGTSARPSPADERPCGNIDPLGITGTPVVRTTAPVYVVAEYGGAAAARAGRARPARPARCAGSASSTCPASRRAAMQERGALDRRRRPGLGAVRRPGRRLRRLQGPGGRRARSTAPATRSRYTVPTAREAGIWTPPGPVGRRAAATCSSRSATASRASVTRYDHSDSVLEARRRRRGCVDSFSPTTWATDNDADLDLGSQGPALVGRVGLRGRQVRARRTCCAATTSAASAAR